MNKMYNLVMVCLLTVLVKCIALPVTPTEETQQLEKQIIIKVLALDLATIAKDVYNEYCEAISTSLGGFSSSNKPAERCETLISQVRPFTRLPKPTVYEGISFENAQATAQNVYADTKHLLGILKSVTSVGSMYLLKDGCFGSPDITNPCAIACNLKKRTEQALFCHLYTQVIPRTETLLNKLKEKYSLKEPVESNPTIVMTPQDDLQLVQFYSLTVTSYTAKQLLATHEIISMI